MLRFDCFTLGFFLLTVGAVKEDFQSNLVEQMKGTDVIKHWLFKTENVIDHDTEAVPTKNPHGRTTVDVTAEFLQAVLFDIRPTQVNERISITKAPTSQSKKYFTSKNVQNSSNFFPSVTNNSEKISSSTQTAIELQLNDTSEPQVHLSAVAEKAPPWLHALHDDRNHRNANSVSPTSADAGLGVPILSASHPIVIDNPAAWLNDADDKRSQGKRFTNLERNAFQLGTMQSILQNDPADDSKRGNTVTDTCLTCLKDGKVASAEKSTALPTVSPHATSNSLGTEGLALDLNQFTTSLHNFHLQSAGGSKEALIKEIRNRNADTHTSLSERGELIYNQTFLPSTFNTLANQHLFNSSQIKTFFSVEMSSVRQKLLSKQQRHDYPGETSSTERLTLTTAESHHTGGESVKRGEQELISKNVSIWNPRSKLMDFTESHQKASRSFSTNLKNQDISSASVSNTPFIVEAFHSSYKSILPKGHAYSAASHPTARMDLIEARDAITPFSLSRLTASATEKLKSHFLTASADSFISVLRSQTRSQSGPQTKDSLSALLPKDSTIKLDSATEKYSQDFTTGHRHVKKSFVNPTRMLGNTDLKEQQRPNFATINVMPVEVFTNTKLSHISFANKLIGTPSKINQERVFSDHSGNVSKSPQFVPDIHNLKLEDESEQIFTVVTRKEDNNILKTEGKLSREIQKTEEAHKLQDEEGSAEDETLENKREELLGLDKTENAKLEKIINSRAEINRSPDREAEKTKERTTETSGKEHVTLRQDKDSRQGEVKEEGDAKGKGVTKINTENFTQEAAEMQRGSLEEKGAEAGDKEQSRREDKKCNKDIVKEDMKNVPLEHTTDWKELNKESTVENLSSCHSLIKELNVTEHKGIYLSENASQKGNITNKSFSYKVTSNHRPPHLSQRSQRPKQSKKTFPPEVLHTRTTMRLSVLPKEGPTPPPLIVAASQKKEVLFSSKCSHSSGANALKFRDILKTCRPPQSSSAKSTNMLSLSTPPLAATTGFQIAQPHIAVNTSLNVSIIHSIIDHRHKFNTSVLRAGMVLQTANEREQAEYITPSMDPAQHQQMYNDSSTKPPTVAALSSVAHISVGHSQPHPGQPTAQQSQSSSCSDMTLGQPCSFKLSEQTSHPDALHTPTDDNKQRFLQALMPPMSTEVEIDQLSLGRVSPVLNVRTSGSDSSPVTYGLSALKEKSLQANFDSEHENSSSNQTESLLATLNVANKLMVTSEVKHSDAVKKLLADERQSFHLTLPVPDRSKQHAYNAGELSDLNDLSNAKRHHQFQSEGTARNIKKVLDEKIVLVTVDQTGNTAFVESGMIDVLNITFTEKQDNSSLSRQSANDNTLPTPRMNFSSGLTIHSKFTQKIADPIQNVHILTAKTDDFVSVATARGSVNTSPEDCKSLLTIRQSVPVIKTSSLTLVEPKAQSNSHIEPLSHREFLTSATPCKPTPVEKRTKTTQTHSVQQPEQKISKQATEQSLLDLLAMTAISRPIKEAEPGVRAGFSKMAHRARGAHSQTSAVVERMRYSSFEDVKSALTMSAVEAKRPPVEKVSRAPTQDRTENKKHTLPGKTSISQAITGAMTDSVPPAGIVPTEIINKTSCRTIGYAKSGGTSKTSGAGVMDPTWKMSEIHSALTEREYFTAENAADTKLEHLVVPGMATPQVIISKGMRSLVTSKLEHDYTSVDDSGLKKVKMTSDKTAHLEEHGTTQRAALVMKTTQRRFYRETSRAQGALAREATVSVPEAATEETTAKSTEQTLLTERNTKTQLDRRAGKARIFEVQNASRSLHAHAKEMARPESGSRLLPSELELKSELNQKRRTSPHLYLPGVTEISDDLCGSGNYTAEMSLKLGETVEPGDAVPVSGNIRVVINLKTNNSQMNLGVTSCCLSPTTQLDLANSTCCLFSRLAAQPSGITLLPSALSTSASFTISLFQMINYSVVYLHCDLSICLRNHSECERQCFQQRSAFPSQDPGTIVANLRNRISFGPMLKQAKNSTFPKEIDIFELDLVLVIVSLVVGLSLVTVMVLLVWLAYRRRAIWPLHSAAPPRSCCGCLHPRGDLILP